MQVRFLFPAEVEMFDAAAFYEKQVALLGETFFRFWRPQLVISATNLKLGQFLAMVSDNCL